MRFLFFILFFCYSNVFAQTILFLGDSLTEGYGVDEGEAFPAQFQKILEAQKKTLKVINGGVSGATTASGEKRLHWYLRANPTHLVIFLGANDGLRGLKLAESEKNLAKIIELAKTKSIKTYLTEMKLPINYGKEYRKQFEKIFRDLSKKYKIKLIPFPLEGVGGKAALNLPDGIHPNPAGYKIVAQNFYKALEGEL